MKPAKRVYVFGNEYLADDSLAKRVAARISGIDFVRCTSPDELLDAQEEDIVILDVVKDASEVMVINDISRLKTRSLVSLHDFDLAFFLKLMQGMGINKNIRIIGIPSVGNPELLAKKVKACI